jgi:predicted nucleic acid-binding protein
MEAFAETSFLFALYCEQDNSAVAVDCMESLAPGISLSPLVRFEFENGLRFQAGRFRRDRSQGVAPKQATQARQVFNEDLTAGFWRPQEFEFPEILRRAESLSTRFTEENLTRSMDILHVATALQWGARTFLSFDARQAKLAKAAGLKCPLKVR